MMNLHTVGRFAMGVLVVAGLSAASALAADTYSPAHIKAARAAMAAIKITDPFDGILPNIAAQLKSTLIQGSPNFEPIINETVDEQALKLAARRADLEKEAAMIYAKSFTEEELNQIAAFYSTPAGQKLLKDGPIAIRELAKAGDIWATGITRDMSAATDKELEAKIAAQKK
ncbi:MAG: hypothetical protein JWM58_989 [Rhizobium sp.]|nr:hypothetical protein [Rhizobium sp.]